MFSAHSIYDDEGVLLINFQALQQGYILFEEFSGVYGIFHSYFYKVLFESFSWTVNHSNLRWLVVVQWMLTCGVLSLSMGILLKSKTMALLTLILCSMRLHRLQAEPGSTQSVVILLIALFALALVIGPRRFYPAWLGALSAIMSLIKINLGVFFFLASFFALKPTHNRFFSCLVLGGGLLAVTGLLMFLGNPAQTLPLYFLIVSSLISAYILDPKTLMEERSVKGLYTFLLVFTMVWQGILILAWFYGTNWSSILHSIYVGPMRFAKDVQCESLHMKIHHFFITLFPIALCTELALRKRIKTLEMRLL